MGKGHPGCLGARTRCPGEQVRLDESLTLIASDLAAALYEPGCHLGPPIPGALLDLLREPGRQRGKCMTSGLGSALAGAFSPICKVGVPRIGRWVGTAGICQVEPLAGLGEDRWAGLRVHPDGEYLLEFVAGVGGDAAKEGEEQTGSVSCGLHGGDPRILHALGATEGQPSDPLHGSLHDRVGTPKKPKGVSLTILGGVQLLGEAEGAGRGLVPREIVETVGPSRGQREHEGSVRLCASFPPIQEDGVTHERDQLHPRVSETFPLGAAGLSGLLLLGVETRIAKPGKAPSRVFEAVEGAIHLVKEVAHGRVVHRRIVGA